MKKFIAVLISIILCFTVLAFAGCGNNGDDENTDNGGDTGNIGGSENDDGNENGGSESGKPFEDIEDKKVKYTSQIAEAKSLYGNIFTASERNGSLFSDGSVYSAIRTRSVANNVLNETDDVSSEQITIETIKNIVKSNAGVTRNNRSLFNSYIADIFTYTQVQLAIINEYDISSLINTYNLTYNGLDLTGVELQGVSPTTFKEVLPITATFPGTDVETGKVYCQHAHISRSDKREVDTQLEFYYNSDNDMGVTTLNKHLDANGNPVKFEYDYFDFGSGMAIIANADIVNGEIGTFKSFILYTHDKILQKNNNSLSTIDADTVISFIYSETNRIYGKIAELKNANSAIESDLSIEKDETVKSCNVTMDFSVLDSMYIKNPQ